jgi:hypothetical protein
MTIPPRRSDDNHAALKRSGNRVAAVDIAFHLELESAVRAGSNLDHAPNDLITQVFDLVARLDW